MHDPIEAHKYDYVAGLFGNIARSRIAMLRHDDYGNGDDDYQEQEVKSQNIAWKIAVGTILAAAPTCRDCDTKHWTPNSYSTSVPTKL